MSIHDNVFDLMDAFYMQSIREEAERKIAAMPDFEKFFVLGLLRHEEAARGVEGIEAVIRWIADRKGHSAE